MAGPSITDVRERIEAILAIIPGITTVLPPEEMDCALTDAMLPAALVWPGPGTRTRASRDLSQTTRTFFVGVLVERLCTDSAGQATAAEQRTALAAAEALLDVVADYITIHATRLELNKRPMAGVKEVGNIGDEALEFRPWGPDVTQYSAFTLSVPVTTYR